MVDPGIEINDSHIPDQFHILFDNAPPEKPNNWTMMYNVVLTKEGMIGLRDKIDKMLSDYYADEEERELKKNPLRRKREEPKMREISGKATYIVTFPFDINARCRNDVTEAVLAATAILEKQVFNTKGFKDTNSVTLGNPSTSLTVSVEDISPP